MSVLPRRPGALISCASLLSIACIGAGIVGAPARLDSQSATRSVQTTIEGDRRAPSEFSVRLETTRGPILIDVRRDWAPRGADRFRTLVGNGYYDDNRFFRVVERRWAQFGINGDPAVSKAWRDRVIPDDPKGQSNVRGSVAFAFAVPNGRTTQVYIALSDLSSTQDAQGFVPFGRVVEGMEVADALNAEYGEDAGSGIRAGKQQPLFDGGNAYLDRAFPRLDRLIRATLVDASKMQACFPSVLPFCNPAILPFCNSGACP